LYQLSLMQGIDSKVGERLLVARIDHLQADVKQQEEATKAAQEQAFRSGLISDVVVHQAGKGPALRLQEQVVSAKECVTACLQLLGALKLS